MSEVNPKYVIMLNKAYEKYSTITVVDSSLEQIKDSVEKESDIQKDSRLMERISNLGKSKRSFQTNKKTLKRQSHTNHGQRSFSEAENNVLKEFIEKNVKSECKTLKLKEVAKEMNRTVTSVNHQIRKLRLGLEVSNFSHRKFSLTEDKLIIDEAIKHLTHCKSLRETIIQKPREFCKQFNRRYHSIVERWEGCIKCWLLQYYNKNLNQEINPMLANLVNRSFDSILSVDWDFVANHDEFSGYTYIGLRKKYAALMKLAAASYKKHSSKVSLEEVAVYAEEKYLNRRSVKSQPTFEKRQMDCITYFDDQIKRIRNDLILK